MSPRRKHHRKVAILIESSRGYGRELIHGIGQFIDHHSDWQIEYRPRGLTEPVPDWIKTWRGDGILARINDQKLLRHLLKLNVPVIDLRRSFFSDRIPQVGPDDRATVEMLFDHFRRKGFQKFAFVGLPVGQHAPMDLRRNHFKNLLREQCFPLWELEISLADFEGNKSRGENRLIRWLHRLPKRTAILASNDDLGLQLLNACQIASFPVPDHFAVAGIGNDDCLCQLARPKLTSVDLNPVRIGYEAASMLDDMMEHPDRIPSSKLFKPNRIVSRLSTNTIATEDEIVVSCLQQIRNEACNGLKVRDVLRHSRISRSNLEIRFKETLGRTVFQEILSVRLEHVQELLISTEMTIKEIMERSGFNYQGYLMRTFQKHVGLTMKAYRHAYRAS